MSSLSAVRGTRVCARPGCDNRIPVFTPYQVFGQQELYCSKPCVEWALDELKKRKKKSARSEAEDPMLQPAEDFGDAGIVRRFCDNPECQRPITLCWKGRNGEYCSNKCLKTEKENTTNMASQPVPMQDPNDAPPAKPITGGSKKKTAPAAKKAAPAPKAAKPAKAAKAAKPAKAATTSRVNPDATIKLAKGFDAATMRGSRGERAALLKDGMTVGQFKAAVEKAKVSGTAMGLLQMLVAAGQATIKG